MNTTVSVLTAAGTGAIATIAVEGPNAWSMARHLFRPCHGSLPAKPHIHRFWFGTLGQGEFHRDQVILALRDHNRIEVHCHGGVRVVRWIINEFAKLGALETAPSQPSRPPWIIPDNPWASAALDLLTRAQTLRTASILLDQYHGAFAKALADPGQHDLLRSRIPVGRHLVTPWRVVLAGPPNVGKSSLLNALAGYQRSIVSPVPGTTRDVVTLITAFDGWPVELIDTAGIHDTDEPLEQAGIRLAQETLQAADLVLWLRDAVTTDSPSPPDTQPVPCLVVLNKCDLLSHPPAASMERLVSAKTGEGIPELISTIAAQLVPNPPPPGAAVPFLPEHELLLGARKLLVRETS